MFVGVIFPRQRVMEGEIASEVELSGFRSVSEAVGREGADMKLKGRDEDHYIPHVPSDYHSEKGLSVIGGGFDRDAASAVLDLRGDEGERETTQEKVNW